MSIAYGTSGNDGKLTTDFLGYTDQGASVTVQADGKILVAGAAMNSGNFDFALVRYNADGSLDTSFSGDGKLTSDFWGGDDYGQSVTVQADGKIVVAGYANNSTNFDFGLARYNADGSLDTSFSGDGKLTTNFSTNNDVGLKAVVQADGKILVGGYAYNGNIPGTVDFALARYNVDGSLDTNFSGDGKLTTDFDVDFANDWGQSLAVQPDGKIIVAGSGYTFGSSDSFTNNFALARYNANGSLDPSFGAFGKVITDFGFFNEDYGTGVTLQADGKIIVAGYNIKSGSSSDFALVRYNTNGSLDTDFSGDGKLTTDFAGGNDYAYSLALQADGKILVAGKSNTDFALARYNEDGSLDTSFSGDGKLTTDFGGDDTGYSVTIQADGKILVAGKGNSDFALARYNEDGSLDTQFNSSDSVAPTVVTYSPADAAIGVAVNSNVVFTFNESIQKGTGLIALRSGSALGTVVESFDVGTSTRVTVSGSALTVDPTANLANNTSYYVTFAAGTVKDLAGNAYSGTTTYDFKTLGINTVTGSADNDILFGGTGDDQMYGLGGNDTLDGGAGDATMLGGLGNDTYYVRQAGDIVTENPSEGTDVAYSYLASYALTANLENGRILATATANLTGNTLNNVLYAGAGNNVLDGGAGTDTVSYAYATVAITASLTASLGQETEGSGIDTLRNVENLTGSNYDDTLTGNSAANTLNGGKGVDVLMGRDGSDTYYVDNAGDVVVEINSAAIGGSDAVYSYLAAYTLGTNVENGRILATGTANLTGNSLNNILYAGAGDNVLNGGTGTDTVSYAYATAGVTASLAVATAQATGGSGSDTLTAIENLTGSGLGDTLVGNSGANVLDGGLGNDTLAGGLGNDTFVINTLIDVVTEQSGEGSDLIQSAISYSLVDTDGAGANGGNVENLQLTGTANINGTGNSLNNVIYANGGINSIDGGAGSDTVSYLYASATGSSGVTLNLSVVNASGQATASGISGADLVKNVENITGSNYNDTLTGNASANVLDGGAEIDTLTGGDGSDTYYVRDLGDSIIETNATVSSGGTDTVYCYLAAYALGANVENGRLLATGAANLTGNSLNNVLYAGAGNNLLDGASGVDTVSYKYATTAVSVSLASSAAQGTGGSGTDTLKNIDNLTGSNFHDTLLGDASANTLDGLALNDYLSGGAGNDVLLGGEGSDWLIGGLGKDILTGGGGNDVFDFNELAETGITSTSWDVITDFVRGQDKIDLLTIDANTATASVNDAFTAFIASTASFSAAGQLQLVGNTLYGNSDTDSTAEFSIQLTGINNLTSADFVL